MLIYLIKVGGLVMTSQKKENENLNKEKLFKDSVPRSKVQLDIVNKIRAAVANMPAEIPAEIISYRDVIREDGEYYLLYQGSENLQPLAEYLNKNSFYSQKLLKEFEKIIMLLQELDLIKKLFPAGINASHFWIDQKDNIFLMPEEFLRCKRNYNEFEMELPSKDYFVPPEIIEGRDWQLKSYLFNTAAVFYYFLSGETIFSDQDNARVLNKIQTENILEIKALVPEISEDLNSLLMKMLAKDKAERPELKQAAAGLKRAAAENKFKLEAFLERKNLIDNKIVSKKRRNENIKLFFRQSWKVILFFLIVGGGFIYGLGSGPEPAITTENSPAEVVNHFYHAVATKNIGLAKEAVTVDLGEMERLISESHVIEKMQDAYNNPDSETKAEGVYSLEDLEIEEIYVSETEYRFKATYEFNYRDQNDRYSSKIEDELLVEKLDGVWRITELKGDFKDMTAGEYPWRVE